MSKNACANVFVLQEMNLKSSVYTLPSYKERGLNEAQLLEDDFQTD